MDNKLESINIYQSADNIRQIQSNKQKGNLQRILRNILSIALSSTTTHYEVSEISSDDRMKLRELGFELDLYDESYHRFRWSIHW